MEEQYYDLSRYLINNDPRLEREILELFDETQINGRQISTVLILLSDTLDAQFTLESKVILSQEVFSTTGLLPAFVSKANHLSWQKYGKGFPFEYQDAPISILGVEVIFNQPLDVKQLLELMRDNLMDLIKSYSDKRYIALDMFLKRW